jgi:Co/Zn/Cd efflux system component
VLIIVLVINLATFVMMIFAAWVTGSSSLLSGGLDNLGDAATYVLSFVVVASSGRAKASVALFKGTLILAAAVAVAAQIAWRLTHPNVPLFEGMGAAAIANLIANVVCLRLLTPYKAGDVNMSSAWECSRNDVLEGFGVIAASLGVWLLGSGWPDVVVAAILLVLFLRSSARVFGSALGEFRRVSAA